MEADPDSQLRLQRFCLGMPRIYCQALALTGLPDLRHESPLVSVSVSFVSNFYSTFFLFFSFSLLLESQTKSKYSLYTYLFEKVTRQRMD